MGLWLTIVLVFTKWPADLDLLLHADNAMRNQPR